MVSDDYKVMAEYVLKLLNDEQKRKNVAEEAQKFIIEKHTWKETLKNFEKII